MILQSIRIRAWVYIGQLKHGMDEEISDSEKYCLVQVIGLNKRTSLIWIKEGVFFKVVPPKMCN